MISVAAHTIATLLCRCDTIFDWYGSCLIQRICSESCCSHNSNITITISLIDCINFAGVTQLVVTGIVTNQCVESAVRDAADRGFLVTLVEDAVATHTEEDHRQSLKNMKGFSRIVSHDKVVQEMEAW